MQFQLQHHKYNALLVNQNIISPAALKNLCKSIRLGDVEIAILACIEAPDAVCWEIRLFDVGVDDVLFEQEASARSMAKRISVRMRARQCVQGATDLVHLDETVIDLKNFMVWNHGKNQRISKGLLSLLKFFLQNRGRVCHRQEILETLWADTVLDPEGKNLDMQVSKLRRLIEPDPKHPVLLTTIRAVGFEMPI